MESRANSLDVESFMQRIAINLTFGFPETQESYKIILVITEYLTKYLYAVPIKGKSADIIVDELFKYFTMFGVPKEILSDQGLEFNNEKVEQLLKKYGVLHRKTSPYNPQTNEQVEKFNATLAECLRKVTQRNPSN